MMSHVAALILTLTVAAGPAPADHTDETARGEKANLAAPVQSDYFRITVVDEDTGRGVPLVELRTVHNVRYWTDSAGVVAFYEPDLMNHRVFFFVTSHGYQFAKDGFGMRGKALEVAPGGEATLKIKRQNIAQRLYRVTGGGIYRDTLLVGGKAPIEKPLLNADVIGSDSVVNAVYRGKLYWFWGDTNRPDYPLGNFNVPGATSVLPSSGGLDPQVGVNLEYFLGERTFAKETARMPGDGPTWLTGLVAVPNASGEQRLLAEYVKVRESMEVYQRGLVEFDDEAQQFAKRAEFPLDAPLHPTGHPMLYEDGGTQYLYFASPYPLVRVPATAEALADLSQYEAFTCLAEGSGPKERRLDRDDRGVLHYGWKRGTAPLNPQQQAELVRSGRMRSDEALLHLQDVETGKAVLAHGGSVYFNAHRDRYVMIAVQSYGSSFLGEVWYAEADTPLGPWVYARKIVTHDKYSFYNPKQHPYFDQDGGRRIFFEGTYASTFSGNEHPTPRYDYNQLMYMLDLSDDRLALPVAVYRAREGDGGETYFTRSATTGFTRSATTGRKTEMPENEREDSETARDSHRSRTELPDGAKIAFFALDRPVAGAVPVFVDDDESGTLRFGAHDRRKGGDEPQPLFYVLTVDAADGPATRTPLYEYKHRTTGRRAYTTDDSWEADGFERTDQPVAGVWRSPMSWVPH